MLDKNYTLQCSYSLVSLVYKCMYLSKYVYTAVLLLTFTLSHPLLCPYGHGHGISVARAFQRFPPPGVTVVMALAYNPPFSVPF